MTDLNPDVLIVGAGPTGLTLALWLARLGLKPRIVDKAAGPGETSRALAVQARTLEFHAQIGIVDDVLAAGHRIERLSLRTPEGLITALDLGSFGAGLSPYPFAFALPQDIHERVLLHHVTAAGVQVEYGTELVEFSDDGSGITATLAKDGQQERVRASWLAGCDGAHSKVRHGLGIGFPGGAYDQSFYVADVEGKGDITSNGMDVVLGSYGFALMLPVRQLGSVRLIGVVPKEHEADPHITFDTIKPQIEQASGVRISAVNWFSTYRVHHRVADRFRVGRAFLAGDAGHIHSPAGGQGMNTGMGDAVNLAWKLAAVVQGRAHPTLLDSYEPERIAFARLLIATTDRAFRLLTSRAKLLGLWRRYVMPHLMARLLHTRWGARLFFGVISQIRITYRGSALSAGTVGKLSGGDRLPYVADADNFAPLRALDWQIHVHGDAHPAFAAALAETGIPLHRFAWTPAAAKAGFTRDAAYLVRPDGHITVASAQQDIAMFGAFLDRLRIVPRG